MAVTEPDLPVNPVFVGLTRPPMLGGVTVDYLGITALISLCGFILLASPICLLAYIPLHSLGVVLCAWDPHIFRLLLKKGRCFTLTHDRFWGCPSYAPY